jgi:hypothetical protein
MLSTDGKKVLQNGTLQALRSMRAVFYRTLRQKIVLLATARSAWPSKAASSAVEAAAWVLDDPEGPKPMLRPPKRLIYTHVRQAVPLVMDPGS